MRNNNGININDAGYVQDDIPFIPGELIGRGASAKVYTLNQAKDNTDCVKVIRTEDLLTEKDALLIALRGSDFRKKVHSMLYRQCQNEVSIMCDLKDSDHIVKIKEFRTQSDKETGSYILQIRMELLTPLREYLESHKVTPQLVLRLGQGLCKALIACEEKGIIHQDIKISNIFVDEDGTFKLGDFGIACNAGSTNHLHTTGGTLSTMAPEIRHGKQSGFASDIYSLGIVLYVLMNKGLDPFINNSEEQLDVTKRRAALEKRMQPHTLPAPSMADEKLARIICKACSYQPEDRYSSAAEMLDALSK